MKLAGWGIPRQKTILYGRGQCFQYWLLTPAGVAVDFCNYVWDDDATWEDAWFWTD